MDRKRIQCLSNALQLVHIYLQPFMSYSKILVGNCNFFLLPLHLMPPYGVAPGTIAVNVTRLERRFNAVYTHLSSTVSKIQHIIGRKLWHFHTPPLFSGPAGGDPVGFSRRPWYTQNQNACVVKKAWQYVQPFWYNTSVWRMDRRTDRWTDVQPIAKTCFSIADACKNQLNILRNSK